MHNFFYKLYFRRYNNKYLDNYNSRVIVRIFNHFLPYYYKLTASNHINRLNNKNNENREKYIVSLTTFPNRITKVWLTIESILRQDMKPDLFILWLYEGEFTSKSSLPDKLLQQEKRGLEIRFVKENLMPHKKYFYAMQEFPDMNIITIDDDFIYPLDMIKNLIRFHKKNPENIYCILTREIKINKGIILPYSNWNYIKKITSPSYKYLTMGGGGTLFPINSLSKEVFAKENLIKYALKADDLWLKIMSLKNETKVVGLGGVYPRFFIPIIQNNNNRLMDSNIIGGENDRIFNELIEHYNIPKSIFEDEIVVNC